MRRKIKLLILTNCIDGCVYTLHATTEIQEKENLIKQDFSADKPFTKLLTDISQIQCADGKLYISPIMDCYNGEILSLCMRNNMKKELCIDTVNAAILR